MAGNSIQVVSVWTNDVGKTIPFIITSGASALDLTGANVTMVLDNGIAYPMTIVSAGSGTVEYTVSLYDFRTPKDLFGQLRVSFSTNRFYTSSFQVVVRRTIDRDPT
jgi:hypothetical protein